MSPSAELLFSEDKTRSMDEASVFDDDSDVSRRNDDQRTDVKMTLINNQCSHLRREGLDRERLTSGIESLRQRAILQCENYFRRAQNVPPAV